MTATQCVLSALLHGADSGANFELEQRAPEPEPVRACRGSRAPTHPPGSARFSARAAPRRCNVHASSAPILQATRAPVGLAKNLKFPLLEIVGRVGT